jgi:hypothetical protein
MAQLNRSYDPRSYDPSQDPYKDRGTPLPAGEYDFQVAGSEVNTTKAGDGSILSVDFIVKSGPYEGRHFFDQFNLENPNQQAVEIGQRQILQLCHSVGYLDPLNNSDVLHGRSGRARLGIDNKNRNYPPKNKVLSYIEKRQGTSPASRKSASAPQQNGKKRPWEEDDTEY